MKHPAHIIIDEGQGWAQPACGAPTGQPIERATAVFTCTCAGCREALERDPYWPAAWRQKPPWWGPAIKEKTDA